MILASLPAHTPERQWRLLTALETITPDADGWRSVGMTLLGEYAGLSQPHLRRARRELAEAGLIEYRTEGATRGMKMWWRILIRPAVRIVKHSGSQSPIMNHSGSQSDGPIMNHQPRDYEPSAPYYEPPNAPTSDDASQCSYSALRDSARGALNGDGRAPLRAVENLSYEDKRHQAWLAEKAMWEPGRLCPGCGVDAPRHSWEEPHHADGCGFEGKPRSTVKGREWRRRDKADDAAFGVIGEAVSA